MTTLAPPVAGVHEDTSGDHAQCVRLAGSSITERLGGPAIYVPDRGTNIQLRDAVNALGPGWHALDNHGDPMAVLAQSIPQGRYVVVGVYCNPDAVPVVPSQATATHALACYSTDGRYYQVWTGQYIGPTNLSPFFDALFGCVIVWRDGAPPAPVPPSTAEDDMRQFHFVGLQGIEHRLSIRDNGDLIDIYGPSNGAKSQRLMVGADRGFGVDGPPNNGAAQVIDVMSTQGATAGRVIEFTQAGDGFNWTQLEMP